MVRLHVVAELVRGTRTTRKSCRRIDKVRPNGARIFTPSLASQLLWFFFSGNLNHGNPQHRSKESEPNACRNFHCTRSGASGGGGGGAGAGGKIRNRRSRGRSVYSGNNRAIVRCLDIKFNRWHQLGEEIKCTRTSLLPIALAAARYVA